MSYCEHDTKNRTDFSKTKLLIFGTRNWNGNNCENSEKLLASCEPLVLINETADAIFSSTFIPHPKKELVNFTCTERRIHVMTYW